ncbi:MAG: histidine phosphatase family protein [Acidiferrobacterales bacterium]
MTNGAGATLVDLMRHGEPVGGRRYRGQADDPLSETGWRQMRSAVEGLRCWDVIVTSPLLRCAEFARELGGRLALPVLEDGRLREIGFGSWEGRSPDDLRRDDPEVLLRFRRDPVRCRPPGAEELVDFHARVHAAWQELTTVHARRRILVVAHAGVIRMVMGIVLGMLPEHVFRIGVNNAGMTRIRIEQDSAGAYPVLVFHGGRP